MTDNIVKTTKEELKKISYPKNSVGKYITIKVPTISPDESIKVVLHSLYEFSKTFKSINYFYVLNKDKKLVGVVSIKELLSNVKKEFIKEIMNKDVIVSHVHVNKKRVARLAIKHKIKAVPILSKNEKFVGVLTSNNMLSILYEDHRKSMYRRAGIINIKSDSNNVLEQGIWKTFVSRIPWILIGLIGGTFSAQIIQIFQGTLSRNIILAAFIPLIVYIGNAVGAQTQVLFVRDITFNPKLNIFLYALKQFVTTAMIGVVCGLFIWSMVSIFWSSNFIGRIIGLAAFTTISTSTIFAISIPYLFSLFKKDPATGSGPFATILQDLLSILVYFLIVTVLM